MLSIGFKIVIFAYITLSITACSSLGLYNIKKFQPYLVENEKLYWQEPTKSKRTFRKKEIYGADPASLELLDDYRYAKDKNYVYYSGSPIPFADPKTFQTLEHDYALDQKHVYYKWHPIFGADPDSIVIETNGFLSIHAEDDFSVFFSHNRLVPCDRDSWVLLTRHGYNWSKDDQCIYYREQKIETDDADDFKILSRQYGKDIKHVFYRGKVLEGADANTFVIDTDMGSGRAKDKYACYNDGNIIDCKTPVEKSIFNLSPAEAQEYGKNIAIERLKRKDYEKNKILSSKETTINQILESNKDNILSPEDVKSINLKSLPDDYHFQMINTLKPVTDSSAYILTKKDNHQVQFKVFYPNTRGTLTETRILNGEIQTKASGYHSQWKYQSPDCRFVLGPCKQEYSLMNLSGKMGGKETIDQITTFEDGVWKVTIMNKGRKGRQEHTIYDKNGFPLYKISFNKNTLYREFKRQEFSE